MIRHAGDGPKTLACRHEDHGCASHVSNFPAHASGTTTEGSKEGVDEEDPDCVAIPFPKEVEDGVKLGSKPLEDVNLCFWADGW